MTATDMEEILKKFSDIADIYAEDVLELSMKDKEAVMKSNNEVKRVRIYKLEFIAVEEN